MKKIFFILAIFLFIPAVTHASLVNRSSTSLSSGLVGYWTFDGKDLPAGRVNDLSGNGNTGNLFNISTSTFYSTGKLGQGFNFDDIDDYVQIGSPASLDDLGPMTISAWIYPRGSGEGSQGYIVQKSNGFGASGWLFTIDTGSTAGQLRPRFSRDYVTTDLTRFTADGAAPLNKWSHLLMTWDGSATATNVHIYLNGVEMSYTGTIDGVDAIVSDAASSMQIGNNTTGSNTFDGVIDDVRIYNRVLSASEIQTLYTLGNQAVKVSLSPTKDLTSGLVGYWTFDGKDMTTGRVNDISGNGNNGNVANISTTTFYIPGKIGQGILMDGVNDAINFGSAASLDDIETQGGGGMSVSFWIRPSSNAIASIFNKGNNAAGGGTWTISKSNVTNPARMGFSKNGTVASSKSYNSLLDIGVWQHIVLTWNGSLTLSTGVLVYKNGVLVPLLSATDGSGALSDASKDLCIGASGATCTISPFADQALDEVRIYNRVLSATEAQQLYNLGAKAFIGNTTRTDRLTSGLLAYWTFDGKDMTAGRVNDVSGNGNTGNLINIATTSIYAVGKKGQGLRFDGVDDYVTTNDFTSLEGATQASWSVWIKPTSLNQLQTIVGKYSTNGANDSWVLRTPATVVGAGTDDLAFYFSSSVEGNTTTNILATSTWTHAVVVYDGTQSSNATKLKMYINGVAQTLAFAGTVPTSLTATASNVTIGGLSTSAVGQIFPGIIDDIRIYNRALSATEALQIYNMGR